MSKTTTELKDEIRKSLALMRTLRDEIRVQMHVGGMDAKDEWRKLEPELAEIERAATHLSEATCAAVSRAVKRLSKLRSISSAQRAQLRRALEARRAQLQRAVDEHREQVSETEPETGDTADVAEGVIEDRERAALDEHDRALLEEIDHALAKFDEGTYGLSEKTGHPIPIARLLAVPWARCDADEAERIEHHAR